MVAVQDLGNGGGVGGEVALGALRDTASAPGDEGVLGQTRVGVLDLDEGELDTALAEIFDQFFELALWSKILRLATEKLGHAVHDGAYLRCFAPSGRSLSSRNLGRHWPEELKPRTVPTEQMLESSSSGPGR